MHIICQCQKNIKTSNKQLHIYSIFQVHKVEYTAEDSFCFVKGKCTPETRLSTSPYDMWILIDKNGVLYSAECACPAWGFTKHQTFFFTKEKKTLQKYYEIIITEQLFSSTK